MYCKNCGKEIADNAAVCVNCGVPVGKGSSFCHNCGTETNDEAAVCVKCGVSLNEKTDSADSTNKKSKSLAVILAIAVGVFGIHDFYLGYKKRGIIKLICTILAILTSVIIIGIVPLLVVAIWILIDMINIVTGKMTDADGNELV